uniref:Uncharacterized protein n=1 Tax=Populus trichocarpa TaxID=3694 RepID=A0A2K1YHR1_POPTR
MNVELKQHCRLEIQDLEFKGLIQKSRSSWSCVAFYVNKNSKIERGAPRLVINYKPLNKALKLRKNSVLWSDAHTALVHHTTKKVQEIPYLHLANPLAPKIVETYASELGYEESHSCLFYFDNSINTTKIPNWFRQWWDYFGCITELHHPHPVVEKGYKLFKKNFRGTEGEKKFPPMLMFCSKFFVPWVCL